MPQAKPSGQAEAIARKLNSEVRAAGNSPLYDLMVDVLVEKALEVYREYEDSSPNPLIDYEEQSFLEELESKKDAIFARLQNEVRVMVHEASHGRLTAEQTERFISDLRRETWNFIYENYAKPKSGF